MDIYDVTVKLALVNGVSGGLTQIVQQFTNVRAEIRSTQNVLMSFRAALIASWEWQGGKRILHGMAAITAAGGAVLDQQALMLAVGWKQADVARLTATAYRDAARVMAATPSSALAAERTLLGIFGNVKEAQAGLPALLKAEAVLTQAERGAGAENQLAFGIKALDIQGAFIRHGKFSVAAYEAGLHEPMALTLAIPHTLDLRQLFQFTRMAGPAAEAMNFADYARMYGEVVASMGRTGGRGLQQLYHTLLGCNVSKALAGELIAAGIVRPGAIHHIKGSSRDILDYHGIVGYQELTRNAADWAHDVLFPLLAKHGMQGVPGLMQALGAMPITAQRLLSFFLTNWAQIEGGKATVERAEGADSYREAGRGWRPAVKDFDAAWTGLLQALGAPKAGFAVSVLKGLTASIKTLTRLLEAHPWVAQELDLLGVSLGAILMLGGRRSAAGVLKMLGGMSGLGGLARALGLFGAGEEGAVGLGALLTGIPELAIAMGAAAIAADVALKHILDATGGLRPRGTMKNYDDKLARARAEGEWRMTHGSLKGFVWRTPGPTPLIGERDRHAWVAAPPLLRPAILPLPPLPPLPLPPRAGVHVTLNSPISLPIPPLSDSDIEGMFRRAIYSHNAALLHELAAAIVRQQRTELIPVIEEALNRYFPVAAKKHETEQKRRTLLDLGSVAAWGMP